jgi:hypothetical protein
MPNRQDILDGLNRYCLRLDRHDAEMVAGASLPDALDEHGPFTSPPAAFVLWAKGLHGKSDPYCRSTEAPLTASDAARSQ